MAASIPHSLFFFFFHLTSAAVAKYPHMKQLRGKGFTPFTVTGFRPPLWEMHKRRNSRKLVRAHPQEMQLLPSAWRMVLPTVGCDFSHPLIHNNTISCKHMHKLAWSRKSLIENRLGSLTYFKLIVKLISYNIAIMNF